MRALTVQPGVADSLDLRDLPDPQPGPDDLLVEGSALGICGTDRDIVRGNYGQAPPGADRLIVGHESLGRVRHAPPGSGFATDDVVVGIVRRPDPHPCGACAHGEYDMCRNGEYTERGIHRLHGYGATAWAVPAEYAIRLDRRLSEVGVLVEPTSVVAKAWEQIQAVGERSWFSPRTVLVTGAGPIGLLAALLGVQRGLDVHVLDRVREGQKPRLVRELGATYHTDSPAEVARRLCPDVVIEATGAAPVIVECLRATGSYGITCLTGLSPGRRRLEVDAGAINQEIVLDNDVVIGSVSANRRHYLSAARALEDADPGWLAQLLTRRVPLRRWRDAFDGRGEEIKVVLDLTE